MSSIWPNMAERPNTFASLVLFLKECNGTKCIDSLRLANITSVSALKSMDVQFIRRTISDNGLADRVIASLTKVRITDESWHTPKPENNKIHSHTPSSCDADHVDQREDEQSATTVTTIASSTNKRRNDFPELKLSQRASTSLALARTQGSIDKHNMLALVEDNKYAASSKRPREAKWNTWCKFADHWNLPPLPMNVELVKATAACFLAGQYRTPDQYFAIARQKHIETYKTKPSQAVELEITNSIRAITRGMGPSKQKETFIMEHLRQAVIQLHMVEDYVNDRRVVRWPCSDKDGNEVRTSLATITPHPWFNDPNNEVHEPLLVCIIGAWFMTREIELAAATTKDITIRDDARTVTWRLPMSKTDLTGQGVERTHGCAYNKHCRATMNKTKSVCLEPLCPFHCFKTYMFLRTHFAKQCTQNPEECPLVCTGRGMVASKEQSTSAMRKVTVIADLHDRTDKTPDKKDVNKANRVGGHTLRVAGAQLMARMQLDLYLIQLVGRWGSMAVAAYVQQAPLCVQDTIASRIVLDTTQLQSEASGTARLEHDEQTVTESMQHNCDLKIMISNIKDEVEQLRTEMITMQTDKSTESKPAELVYNVNTTITHRAPGTQSTISDNWQTRCGWYFGRSRFRLVHRIPDDGVPCPKCFGTTKKHVSSKHEHDSSTDSSSSSGSSTSEL